MRIASLLPGATEMVAALGAVDDLVAVSHECDHPPEIRGLPAVTATSVDDTLDSRSIDAAVREALEAGMPVIAVEADRLAAARPDVILTQSVCEVCAVGSGEVRRLRDVVDPSVRVVSLSAGDVNGVLEDLRSVGRAIGRPEEARRVAAALSRAYRERLESATRCESRPRIVCIEWLDPVFLAGHWVPELVEAAGGHDVGARAGERSREVTWEHVESLRPDVLLLMPCGFDVERTRLELDLLTDPAAHRLLELTPWAILDGNAYTSRPGPRFIEAVDRIREAIWSAAATQGAVEVSDREQRTSTL